MGKETTGKVSWLSQVRASVPGAVIGTLLGLALEKTFKQSLERGVGADANPLETEAAFKSICGFIRDAGGARGMRAAEALEALQRALTTAHPVYREQLSGLLLSGSGDSRALYNTIKELRARIPNVPEKTRWNWLRNEVAEPIIQRALHFAQRVQQAGAHSNLEAAAKSVATQMIQDKELQGTLNTTLKENLHKVQVWATEFEQEHQRIHQRRWWREGSIAGRSFIYPGWGWLIPLGCVVIGWLIYTTTH